MVSLQYLRPLLFLAFAYLIYTISLERKSISEFVPHNSFEVPTTLEPKEWQKLNDKFGTLVQVINTTTFAVAYQLDNMIAALSTILNNVGVGKFDILSVGTSSPLTLNDVVVQDVNTLAVTRFKRIDFIVESLNPFIIQKVVITPDKQFLSSQNVLPSEPMAPKLFRINNPLHLFHPFKTSDDEMRLRQEDIKMFQDTMVEKSRELENMATRDAVSAGTVKSIPAMSLPSAAVVSKEIVGAGPLHPIGL